MSRKLVFRVHALRRMFERRITVGDVEAVLETGEVIERYPGDIPYPSRLVLGWRGSRPVHVVVAESVGENELIVITAYEPDRMQWEADFKRRKP
jgi:hypothetical protein